MSQHACDGVRSWNCISFLFSEHSKLSNSHSGLGCTLVVCKLKFNTWRYFVLQPLKPKTVLLGFFFPITFWWDWLRCSEVRSGMQGNTFQLCSQEASQVYSWIPSVPLWYRILHSHRVLKPLLCSRSVWSRVLHFWITDFSNISHIFNAADDLASERGAMASVFLGNSKNQTSFEAKGFRSVIWKEWGS